LRFKYFEIQLFNDTAVVLLVSEMYGYEVQNVWNKPHRTWELR